MPERNKNRNPFPSICRMSSCDSFVWMHSDGQFLPLPVSCIGTFHPLIRRTEFHIAAAFHADSGNQMIAFPAGIQTAPVQLIIRFFFRFQQCDFVPDAVIGIVFRRFPKQAPFAFLHSYLMINLTTEQGGRTVLNPSAVASKAVNSLTETAFLSSKLLWSCASPVRISAVMPFTAKSAIWH